MSLLDDVSILITPNGYKAGTLHAAIPTPTEGAEILSQPVDLVTDFLTNSGGVIVDDDTFTTSGGSLDGLRKQSFLTVGTRYKLTIEGDTTSSGFTIGSLGGFGDEYGSGLGTFYFTALHSGVWIRQGTAGTTNITSFTIKEVLVPSADMDVTRSTAATRVDENGLVNYAEIIGGEEVTDGSFPSGTTSWADGTGVTLSLGKAELLNTPTYSFSLSQTLTELTVGLTYLVSYEIDDYLSGQLRSRLGSNLGATISDDGVYEELITAQSNALIFQTVGVSFTGSISNVSVKEVTRDNVPRIDYTGGGCPHILAEPQRTNLFNYSEDFSNWNTFRSLLTPNETTSPDGTTNADLIEQDYPNTSVHGGLNKQLAVTTGVEYTYSFFVKKKEYSWIELAESTTSAANVSTWFDVETGVVGNVGAGSTAQIKDFGSGWYRCSISFTSTQTSNRNFILYLSKVNGSSVADIVGGVYIWGAQLEVGSYATSYIPTNGEAAGVTRNQDIFTRDGIGSLINSTEGVLFVEMAALASDGTYRYVKLNDGTAANSVQIRYSNVSNNIQALVYSSSGLTPGLQAYTSYTFTDATSFHKIAFRYKENEFTLFVDGSQVAQATSGIPPINLSSLNFSNFSGKVKQLQVYDTALTDTQLAALTS
jgi:hypothetical protein